MDATLPAVAEELLKEIEKDFHETSHVPDDHLRALKFIFGASAVPALDLVDCQAVTRIVSPSGRTVYQVLGSSRKLYSCYASCHFCPCPAFTFSVLRKGDSLVRKAVILQADEGPIDAAGPDSSYSQYNSNGVGKIYSPILTNFPAQMQPQCSPECKHLLAIYLSRAMGTCQELTVPDKQLTKLLLPEEEEEGG